MEHLEKELNGQELIKYCPLCGYHSNKKFDHGEFEYGGDWVCENCDKRVEAYILEREAEPIFKDDNNRQGMSLSIPLIGLITIIILIIYFLIQSGS